MGMGMGMGMGTQRALAQASLRPACHPAFRAVSLDYSRRGLACIRRRAIAWAVHTPRSGRRTMFKYATDRVRSGRRSERQPIASSGSSIVDVCFRRHAGRTADSAAGRLGAS